MFFKQLPTRDASLSYLFGCIGHSKAVAVDVVAGDEAWFVVTGDTLFVGAVGRPDLAGREVEMAGMLYDSLHGKLLNLPPELELFPAHQAGSACGVGISGKPSSTIGFEKRWNANLSLTREEFIAALASEIPPRPANMDAILATNTAA
jgi:hydroxyacylglutathione hydrolase